MLLPGGVETLYNSDLWTTLIGLLPLVLGVQTAFFMLDLTLMIHYLLFNKRKYNEQMRRWEVEHRDQERMNKRWGVLAVRTARNIAKFTRKIITKI